MSAGSAQEAILLILEQAYGLGLCGRREVALQLLESQSEAPTSIEPAMRDALDIARARLLALGAQSGDRIGARRLLEEVAARSSSTRWRPRLELARLARDEGRAVEAASFLQEAVHDFRQSQTNLGRFAAPLAGVFSDDVTRQVGVDRADQDRGVDRATSTSELLQLVELGRALAAVTDPDEVLRLVLRHAIELTGSERGFIVLSSGNDATSFAVAERFDRSDIERPAFEVSRSLIAEVTRTRRVMIIHPRHADPLPASESLDQLGITAVACVPIVDGDEFLGALYLDRRREFPGPWRSNPRVLELFSKQAAAALRNARAHDDKARALAAAQELVRRHRSRSRRRSGYDRLVGTSEAMQRLYERLDMVIPTEIPVVLLGETGTGKDLVARLIHEKGPRREGEFVAINCAGLAESLLEAELFGYERGAFTGADRQRAGLFEVGHRGTVFLDEVGEMSPRMQAGLLRVLQSGEVRRVGGQQTIRVDVRVLAATHRDLEERVRTGDFRQDLYFRLNVLTLRLPSLRDRPDDIPLLFRELFRAIVNREPPAISTQAMNRLLSHSWPGNVRQLENLVRRLAIVPVDRIEEHLLPEEICPARSAVGPPGPLREAETAAILRAVEVTRGNKAQAARILGIDRKTLRTRLKELERAGSRSGEI